MTSVFILLILCILYFAARVTKFERRIELLEAEVKTLKEPVIQQESGK
ncbi:MAG: hypothetical protein ACRC7I_06625 [Selenomonadaceae bacterium]